MFFPQVRILFWDAHLKTRAEISGHNLNNSIFLVGDPAKNKAVLAHLNGAL